MSGVLDDVVYGYNPEELTVSELLEEIYDRKKRVDRLEDLKAPEIIIEHEREKFIASITELSKYMSMTEIDKHITERSKNRHRRK